MQIIQSVVRDLEGNQLKKQEQLLIPSPSLRSKRFQSSESSYCAKVRAEAFLLLSQLSRRSSRGNACYAGYPSPRSPLAPRH